MNYMKLTVNLIVLFLVISVSVFAYSSNEVQDGFMVFKVEIEPTPGESIREDTVKDFYISGGEDDGLSESMVLNVFRAKIVGESKDGNDAAISVPVGKLKVSHVYKNVAIARIESLTSSEDNPVLEYRTVMIGDYAAIKKEPVVLLPSNVLFKLGDWKLKPEAKTVLSTVYETYSKLKDRDMLIEGYTCSLGEEKYNSDLSRKRAKSVADYFIKKTGISGKHVHIDSHGEKSPIASNKTKEGREKNRRVEIRFVPRKK